MPPPTGRRVVDDITDPGSVQRDLEMRSLEGNLEMVPVFLLAEIGKLFVAGVEPEDVASDGLRMHAVNDHADELPRLATSDVDLIAGPQGDAAVVRACAARTVRGGRLLGEHEVELQLEILVNVFRDETAPSAALAA